MCSLSMAPLTIGLRIAARVPVGEQVQTCVADIRHACREAEVEQAAEAEVREATPYRCSGPQPAIPRSDR